tara:strand:+ start:578 stop:682 length:105 start_codon:yes stop_codon:yes gene_type:complete
MIYLKALIIYGGIISLVIWGLNNAMIDNSVQNVL